MLNRTAILSAILLGLAVPSSAQEGNRSRQGNSARHTIRSGQARRAPATRAVRSPRLRRDADRSRGAANPVLRTTGRSGRGSLRTIRPVAQPAFARGGHGTRGYHYETRRVFVPGVVRSVFVPAQYESQWDRYRRTYVRVCVREAYYRNVQEHGHWVYRRVRVDHHHGHGRRGGIQIHF